MQNRAWMALLRLVAPTQQENLVLTTTTGLEIAVQTVIRAEDEYVVVRGRQTGTTEGGGVFFVPYDQVHFLGFQKTVRETDIRALYGDVAAAEETSEGKPAEVEAPAASPAEPGAPTTPVNGTASPTPPPGRTSKADLLERLRSRRQEGGNPRTAL